MLLETLKSLVKRSRKRKDPNLQTQLLPDLVENPPSKLATTPSDTTHTRAHPGNAQDLNARPPDAGEQAANQSSASTHCPVSVDHPAPASTYFPNAQNFVINSSTTIANIINFSGIVLQLVAQKRIPGAEVDSSARDPPPKCHPDTRTSLRGRIIDWVNGSDRHWRMLWIIGPMGVGKSAVAQTIAEELKASGRLGASLFFSRPNHRDDPNGVIPTLVYQLAVKCPEYKRIITQRLADDATILEKNRRTQFKELIIEPFQILMTQQPQVTREPFVVILDGLDECNGKEAQCEFIELISDHVRQVDGFPLLWMICSRPEWHLKTLLSHPDFQVTCQREDILIDDAGAQHDVARVLEAGFQDIHRRYYDRLGAQWPPQVSIRHISVTASGHFAFASTIIKFVGDEYRSDPQTQLDICIRFIGSSGMPGAVNPLHALDLLYRNLLSDVPRDILATTLRILGLLIIYPSRRLTVLIHANFLCIDQATFYRSLQHLHSVIDVPTPAGVCHHRLNCYHALSFADYLIDPLRSGSFSINEQMVHYDTAVHSAKWLRSATQDTETERDMYHAPYPRLKWLHDDVSADEVVSSLRSFSSAALLGAYRRVSDKDIPGVVAELEHIDFGTIHLGSLSYEFCGFLAWLYSLGDRNNSLISKEKPTDEDIKTEIFMPYYTYSSIEEVLSRFDYHCPVQDGEATIRLWLGRQNVCRVEMTVLLPDPDDFTISPVATRPPSPTPSVHHSTESLPSSSTSFSAPWDWGRMSPGQASNPAFVVIGNLMGL